MTPVMAQVASRYEGIQTILGRCGESGCKFLSLLSIAEESSGNCIDLIYAIRVCQAKKWLTADFTVKDNLAILEHFTGYRWTREGLLPSLPSVIRDNQYTEVAYHLNFTHFRRRYFDTLINSSTVKYGKIEGYYIYTRGEKI